MCVCEIVQSVNYQGWYQNCGTNLQNIYHNLIASTELQSIRLPSKMRKRGRPKGADKTVIGLPRKKSRGSRPVSFLYKGAKQKELGMYVK